MTSCSSGDPAPGFMADVDRAPAEKRPPNWERTKALMARPAGKADRPSLENALKDFRQGGKLGEFSPVK